MGLLAMDCAKLKNIHTMINSNLNVFAQIVACELLLYFEASDEAMKKRLMKRGENSDRSDDNENSIKKRLATFHEFNQPILAHYEKQKKLRKINADNAPNVVYEEVKHVLDEYAG